MSMSNTANYCRGTSVTSDVSPRLDLKKENDKETKRRQRDDRNAAPTVNPSVLTIRKIRTKKVLILSYLFVTFVVSFSLF